jgi:archaellum biogenesis protein FlaJ (TadC family)
MGQALELMVRKTSSSTLREMILRLAYNLLKTNGESSSKSSKSKKLKSMIKDYSNDFSRGEMYRMIDEVYKKSEDYSSLLSLIVLQFHVCII